MKNSSEMLACGCMDCQCTNCRCEKRFWIWAIVRICIVVALIVGAFILGTYVGFGKFLYHFEPRMGMSHMMIAEKACSQNGVVVDCDRVGQPVESHMMAGGMMGMSMDDMRRMLEGKTGDALDKAFLEGMIPHHEGAVEMAKYLVNAKHPELQQMGQDIIKAQTKEIEQMQKWLKEWGYESSTGTTMTGMMMDHSMMMR